MKTINFNTGRKYTAEGQVIIATLHDDGVVTFFDHSRQIDGEFELMGREFNFRLVWDLYDHNHYKSTVRSRADGMYRNGCNSRSKNEKV